ncbi:MAG: hypothetical protein ACI4JZ_07965, partial [Oscillospiraceae bacterium]
HGTVGSNPTASASRCDRQRISPLVCARGDFCARKPTFVPVQPDFSSAFLSFLQVTEYHTCTKTTKSAVLYLNLRYFWVIFLPENQPCSKVFHALCRFNERNFHPQSMFFH